MKLKYLFLIINISLILILCYCTYQLTILEYDAANLPDLNNRYKYVEDGLSSGIHPEILMSEYDCTILLISTLDYYSDLYTSINRGDIIFDYTKGEVLLGKIIFERKDDSFQNMKLKMQVISMMLVLFVLCILDLYFLFLYLQIIRPFRRLQKFASNISIGNLDLPLDMQRNNYFGAFTESFDVMREALKKAREGELQANRSKKELVASLSHDIKTPVSTIMALCEILEIKLSGDDNIKKIHTIHQKADTIDKLISNMFHATLSELEVLKIEPTEEPSTVLSDIFGDLEPLHPLYIKNELPSCLIVCDKLRLLQVIDNLLNNSYKYAGTEIDVTYRDTPTHLLVEIRDYGEAVEDVDLALVCEKFYRGHNSSEKAGSGLGLYLAKQFLGGMGGSLICEKDNGFVVTLSIRKAA